MQTTSTHALHMQPAGAVSFDMQLGLHGLLYTVKLQDSLQHVRVMQTCCKALMKACLHRVSLSSIVPVRLVLRGRPDCHCCIVPVGLACDLRICSALTCHLSALMRRMRRWLIRRVSSSTDSADLSIWLSVETGRRAAAAAAWWPCMAIRTDAS